MSFNNRKSFFRANRYQIPIIVTALVPTTLFCSFLTVFVLYLHGELINLVRYNSQVHSVEVINQWGLAVLISIWIFFALVYFWVQLVSSRSVGAFGRILRELDGIIDSKKYEKKLRARERDLLANELLKRINVLLEKIQQAKTGGDPSKSIGRF